MAIVAALAGGVWFFGYSKNGVTTPQADIAAEQTATQVVAQANSSTGQQQSAIDTLAGGAASAKVVATDTVAAKSVTIATALAGLGSNIYANGILPLGDYKYTTTAPKKGYVYLCNVMQGGGGAEADGPWIGTSTWNSNGKTVVAGAISWPTASITISVSGTTRTIVTNDLPTGGTTGIFPIASTDPAYQYDTNPNSVEAQNLSFSLPANPTPATTPGCIYGEVGVMTNGVMLLDGFDELYRDAAAHEVQDSCDGHPHEGGVYHYHSLSSCISDATVTNIIGWAFDGYPITGPEISAGRYLTTADLDECHGITSPVMENGALVDTYHYVMTQDFPYSVSCFHGKSYEPKPGQTQSSQSGGSVTTGQATTGGATPPAPPQAAIDACTGKSSGTACSVGPGSGTCATIGTYLACKPQ